MIWPQTVFLVWLVGAILTCGFLAIFNEIDAHPAVLASMIWPWFWVRFVPEYIREMRKAAKCG